MHSIRYVILAGITLALTLPATAMALTARCYNDPEKLRNEVTNSYITNKKGLGDSVVTIDFDEEKGTASIETRTGDQKVVNDSVPMIGGAMKLPDSLAKKAPQFYPFVKSDDNMLTTYVLMPEKQKIIISTMNLDTVIINKAKNVSGPIPQDALVAHCDIK